MPIGLGIQGIMGVSKESTFRTAVAATDRAPMLSEGINFDYTDALHEYLSGGAGLPGIQRVFEPVTGTAEFAVPYSVKSSSEFVSASLILALGMGTVTWDAGQGSNQITLLDDLNTFGTFAWRKYHATVPWEAISVFVNSFTLSCEAGSYLKLSAELIAYDLKIASTTNAVSDLTSLPTDVPDLVLFKDFVFRIGDQAGALGAGDQIGISSFSITVNNNLTASEQTTPDNASTHTDAAKTIQPVRNGFREVTVEFVVPRYDADTFMDHWSNEDNLQMDLLGTQGSSSEEFDIILPNLKVEDVDPPIGGPEAITQTVTLRALKRNSASDVTFSDGSTTDSGEIWVETDDDRTAAIF